MTNSKDEGNDKNPTNGTLTAQLVRRDVIVEYRADEITLKKIAFGYLLHTTMRGPNVVYMQFQLPEGITGNRDKYTFSNPDGQATATCELKYTSDPAPLRFQASSGEITFHEFDTVTENVHARFYVRATGTNNELLQINGGRCDYPVLAFETISSQ